MDRMDSAQCVLVLGAVVGRGHCRHPVGVSLANPRLSVRWDKNYSQDTTYRIEILFLFASELVKSNLDVARRVISPKLPINPGIVEIKTRLKHPTYRLILANSITLTPGTLTVEMIDDSLFIHWIDVTGKDIETATHEISEKYESYLLQLSDTE